MIDYAAKYQQIQKEANHAAAALVKLSTRCAKAKQAAIDAGWQPYCVKVRSFTPKQSKAIDKYHALDTITEFALHQSNALAKAAEEAYYLLGCAIQDNPHHETTDQPGLF